MNALYTKTQKRFLISSFVVLYGMFPYLSAADSDTNGVKVYLEQGCYSCHGYNGTGRYPLANDVSGIMFDENIFLAFLRQRADISPTSASNRMPNYSVEVLNDEDAKDVYRYIKTFIDKPPEIDDIPALKEIIDNAQRSTSND